MSGWIADYRKELESNIWLMPPMYHRVWQWIKYSVNHEEAKIPNRSGGVTIIKPGQRATSYRQIAKGCGYYESVHKWKEPNIKMIKVILDWMVAQGMITVKGNAEGTVITIENWALYQDKPKKGNGKETLKKHLADTNNNEVTMSNNEEQKKNSFYDDVFSCYIESGLVAHKSITQDMKNAIDKAKKELGLDVDYMKRIIDRHKQKVEATKGDGQYAVKVRTLSELFGQKKHGSVSLICSDYLDEVWQGVSLQQSKQYSQNEVTQAWGGLMKNKPVPSFNSHENAIGNMTKRQIDEMLERKKKNKLLQGDDNGIV